jgi:hypothetical protein
MGVQGPCGFHYDGHRKALYKGLRQHLGGVFRKPTEQEESR